MTKRKYKLSDTFLRNRTEELKEQIKESFTASRSFMNVFVEELEGRIDRKIKDAETIRDYEKASWPMIQADNFGYRRALRDILNLIVDNKQDKK